MRRNWISILFFTMREPRILKSRFAERVRVSSSALISGFYPADMSFFRPVVSCLHSLRPFSTLSFVLPHISLGSCLFPCKNRTVIWALSSLWVVSFHDHFVHSPQAFIMRWNFSSDIELNKGVCGYIIRFTAYFEGAFGKRTHGHLVLL